MLNTTLSIYLDDEEVAVEESEDSLQEEEEVAAAGPEVSVSVTIKAVFAKMHVEEQLEITSKRRNIPNYLMFLFIIKFDSTYWKWNKSAIKRFDLKNKEI